MVQASVGELTKNGAVNWIKLGPMGVKEAVQFFGPHADPRDVDLVLRESGGNPLFLRELASARRDGREISGRDLDSLIADRICRLDPHEQELIVFAAATTRDFKPELGAAMELPALQLLERIDRLERRGLLKPASQGRFDLVHDLVRQTTYRSLSQSRRELIHRQFSRVLDEAVRRDQTLAGELAYHAGAAGDHSLAVQACIAAGEQCLHIYANSAAIDAADQGLGHLADLRDGPDRAHCHIALLKLKVFASASPGFRARPRLLAELEEAVQAADLMGLRSDASLGWHMIAWCNQHTNETLGAQRATLRGEEISRRTDALTRCQQLANTAHCLLEVEGDVEQARTFLREADELASALDHNFVELDWGKGLIARWDGDLGKAQESMHRALVMARLHDDRWREIECLIWIAKIAIKGDVAAYCDQIDAIAARIGDGPAPVADALRALALMRDQDAYDGSQLQQRLTVLRAFDDKAQLAYILNQVAAHCLGDDRLEDARVAAAEGLSTAQEVKRSTEIIVARSLIACIEARSGAAGDAGSDLELLIADANNSCLSARARQYVNRVKETFRNQTPV
jgi:hypothetical protein